MTFVPCDLLVYLDAAEVMLLILMQNAINDTAQSFKGSSDITAIRR